MANYNGARHLKEALDAVLGQSLAEIEVLLSDDGSTDDSLAIARDVAATDRRLKILADGVNAGPARARNRALDAARGEWVSIVDADDVILPERFACMLEAAETLGARAIADNLTFFGEPNDQPRVTLLDPEAAAIGQVTPELLILSDMNRLGMLPLGYLKPIFRRTALDGLRYGENIRIGEDFDFYMRFVLRHGPIQLLPQSYYRYRRHEHSLSHRLSEKDVADIIAAQERLLKDHPDMDTDLAALFARRKDHLNRTLNFERLVGRIKRRQMGAALGQVAGRPDLLIPLSRAMAEHLRNRHRSAGHRTARESVRIPPEQTGSPTAAVSARAPAAARAMPGRVRRTGAQALTHIRTPTYKRPEQLRRCLESLQNQTFENWICDVYDDDPQGSARAVVQAMGDPRIVHRQNATQKFASRNIDQCFSRMNPHDADYFCVVEDDNFILPRFVEDNIRICETQKVEIVFRNQLIEFESGTSNAHLSDFGILDRKLTERKFDPDRFRLSLLADIGVSNGGLFWSRDARTDLEIHFDCSATLQEYLRTYTIREPIYVAMEPLAVWAENGAGTTRDLGFDKTYLRRELNLKRSIAMLQRAAWNRVSPEDRSAFLENESFAYPVQARARGLVKSHIRLNVGPALGVREKLWLFYRGMLIRIFGRPEAGVRGFIANRGH